ncbi:MAG: DUF4836 family protein [Ferruginibacter sp.]
MQKCNKYWLLFPLLSIWMFSSCSKTNKEGRYIPNGVALVIHLNGKSLSSKLPWEEIKQSEVFKEAYSDSSTSAFIRTVLDDPENTGIDIKNDIIFFALKDSLGGYMAIQGTLKDEAKFRQFNKEAAKNTAVESDENGIHFSNTQQMTGSWNKEKFVMVMDAPMFNMTRSKNMYNDSSAGQKSMIKRDMVPIAKQIFNLKEDKSLATDERFTALMKSGGDMHFLLNSEAVAASGMSGESMGPLSMMNISKLYEGSRVTGTVNFENGKIVGDFKSYAGKEMTELMNKYSGDKINGDMIKRIPSKNLAAMLALNFKPEGIREFLKLMGMEGFANMGSSMIGITLDDFIKANKGDILLAVTDIKQDTTGKPDLSVLFSASIADRPSFNKLVSAGRKFGQDKMQGPNGPYAFDNINERYFALGTKKDQVDQFITGAGNNSFDFMEKISGSAGAAYINFQYILSNMAPTMARDSFAIVMHQASIKMWDNLLAYGIGDNSQHVEITLVDKNTNSLKQLNSYLGTVGMAKHKQDRMYKKNEVSNMMEKDTTGITVK